MRHSKTEKANTHKRIVAIAAKKFREGGTHRDRNRGPNEESRSYVGSFYKHFKSRDALVAEAVGSTLEMLKNRVEAASEAHRDHPGMENGTD